LEFEGKTKEAIAQLSKAVELDPNWPVAHNELAKLLASEHRSREAIGHLQGALELDPGDFLVRANLAWMLATTDPAEGGDPQRAVALAEGLYRILPSPGIHELETLAAAYAAAGRYAEAAPLADRARKMAASTGQNELAKKIEGRLKLYAAKRPYRE
jgi:spermidine synthase